MRGRGDALNQEGYKDPTAERAIREYNRLPHRTKEALYHLQVIASMMGFEIVEIKDKHTGRKYKCQTSDH